MNSASKTAALALYGLLFAVLPCCLAAPGFAQSEKKGPALPRSSIDQDLLRRLRSEPVSQGTLDSLDVPADFLDRVADRIIRMDYQKRFRGVAKDPGADQAGSAHASGSGSNSRTASPPSQTTRPGNPAVIGVGAFGGLVVLFAVLARRRQRSRR